MRKAVKAEYTLDAEDGLAVVVDERRHPRREHLFHSLLYGCGNSVQGYQTVSPGAQALAGWETPLNPLLVTVFCTHLILTHELSTPIKKNKA